MSLSESLKFNNALVVGFQFFIKLSFSFSDKITVRQILDPYVDDVQYIAWGEVTLESNGDLCLSKIGLGMPGDCFFVGHTFNFRHVSG